MKIDELTLNNFRNFESATFHFSSLFTVIIGENGQGKSSILQGLRVAAASFLLGIDEADRYHIQKEDVRRVDLGNRFVPQKNCGFVACGTLNGEALTWARTLATLGGRTDYRHASELIERAKMLNDAVNAGEERVDLPVICFFSTARLWAEVKQTFKLKAKGMRLKDGYARCMDASSDKRAPMEWIKAMYWKKLKGKTETVLLEAVLEAIDLCVPHWTPTEWDEDSDDLGGIYTHEDGTTTFVPLQYLSDGLRTMAGMVAEIAYRCVTLNAYLGREAVRQSRGIVMIDELDMHLHPNWQRSVVPDLKRAFPALQFIATTHSPFIVQSLANEELINLGIPTEEDPHDLDLHQVAREVMHVDAPHSLIYENTHQTTAHYLALLEEAAQASGDKQQALIQELETIEAQAISDPAFVAFLQMNRLAKIGHPNRA